MAKGLRSKYKKRLRAVRATQLYEMKGKHQLAIQSAKLYDKNYSMAADHAPKPNAFVHPNNPTAVFPQIKKPDIVDLRISKIKNGGLVTSGTFRKHLSSTAKQSKFPTIVKTTEMLEQEKLNHMSDDESSEGEQQVAVSQKVTTIDDITALTANMKIGKKRPKEERDVEMPKISAKSKGIRKPCKKLRKQLGF